MEEKNLALTNFRALKWIKISLGLSLPTIVATGLTMSFTVNQRQHAKLTTAYPSLSYNFLTGADFDNLSLKINSIKNIYIKNMVSKGLVFYLPNDLFASITSKKITPEVENTLTRKLTDLISGNMRVWGLTSQTQIDPSALEAIPWGQLIKINNSGLTFDNVIIKYQGGDEQIVASGKFLQAKTVDYDLKPIEKFNVETVNYLFENADIINKSLNRSGYFGGLNFYGQKVESGPEKGKWLEAQYVDLNEFNTMAYDWMITSLKSANLIKDDLMANAVTDFQIRGWDEIYVNNPKGVTIEKDRLLLSQDNYFGAHSIVSKIQFSWSKLSREPISFKFTGSYLSNTEWNNY
ncbi:hypothetical protein JN01_0091 [Entomoplasma freundtii]|uniref:Uncharacterized protein n=1 Tax=Entomoplasma freundtii TaxID=74700 RepID=A0A2K8NSD7_9MOLU|nr:hypothetical protein [Entomoplasma freundtii]ATZ16687.1 hypothetical protein EFREU_v1c06670 [Entomoplasma freundtii]TDY58146.1 hypothetical protein JN01_0091 [Entomoplasma freundtii]